VAVYTDQAKHASLSEFLLSVIPVTPISALTDGSILQVLFVAIITGVALALMGESGAPIVRATDRLGELAFRVVAIIMRAAPIGAFAAMAFTIGHYGVGALANLITLVLTFYVTSALFVLLVLGAIARLNGFSVLRLIAYLKAELLLVLGTSSSESALPSLIKRLEDAGCAPGIVGLVVPLGYSFNLDGTNIYLTLAALFIAQACGIDLSLADQMALMAVAVISSKGAAGVTGAGFITLAATLAVVPSVPVAGMALILGVDRFMSECRSITNFIGNAVATIVIARWEGELDRPALDRALGADGAFTPS
jgi:aerobic C4-dicarboxylate transport protein